MQVIWNDCVDNKWCGFHGVDLFHSHFDNMEGVYIIWHAGANPAIVRVGQGVIKDRIAKHRTDPLINNYKNEGLYVTWASVEKRFRDGVERYLAESLSPKVGDKFPDVQSIMVNLPW
jgi:hypothetical protein